MDKVKEVGDRVEIVNSMLYTGRTGTLRRTSNDPEDFWDWYVVLEGDKNTPVRTIGVTVDQIKLVD